MKKNIVFVIISITLITLCFTIEPAKAKFEQLPKLRGDEIVPTKNAIPYLGGRQSPGDSIGMTYKDMHEHTHGKRIMVDDYGQAHINWMWLDSTLSIRYCAWNARYTDGTYFGTVQASPSYSGFVQIDVTPNDQKSVIAYHLREASDLWYAWIDIDTGNLAGNFPNDPKGPMDVGHIWPFIAVANNGNIVMATGDDAGYDTHHVYVTIDTGDTWIHIMKSDSIANPTQFVAASPHSNKVVFVHTRFINDSFASAQVDQDVWYMVSTDGGVTWGPYTNLTNYQPYPIDSVRGYAGVDAVFDNNDNLHIVWEGRRVDNTGFWEASKIFHWDEVSDTFTVVNSPSTYYNDPGGWWITTTGGGEPGCYRMPADRPQIIVDPNIDGYLYCLWHGNDDYYDTSSLGRFNGELYGSYSSDNGITWSDYVNLTNTRSPGAPPGECMSEDFMTANPYVVNDSIFILYIEDKNSGHYGCWGEATENPVRCWVFHRNFITGIEENEVEAVKSSNFGATIFSGPLPLPEGKKCKVFDVTGRTVVPDKIRPGIYFIEVDGQIIKKVIKVR